MVAYLDKTIKLAISDFYYPLTVGKKTWYWVKKTGEFDGTSWEIN